MFGFTGIGYSNREKSVNPNVLKEMCNSIAHRGPDDEGFYIQKNIGLGFRRLSIIDLSSGHQPMCDSLERAWIVFNGEIFNYHELKEELSKEGYVFKTNSDTEVLVLILFNNSLYRSIAMRSYNFFFILLGNLSLKVKGSNV